MDGKPLLPPISWLREPRPGGKGPFPIAHAFERSAVGGYARRTALCGWAGGTMRRLPASPFKRCPKCVEKAELRK